MQEYFHNDFMVYQGATTRHKAVEKVCETGNIPDYQAFLPPSLSCRQPTHFPGAHKNISIIIYRYDN